MTWVAALCPLLWLAAFVAGRWVGLVPAIAAAAAVLTALALVVLIVVSRFVMQFWVDLYARDYGGLGVVLAIYFWLAIASGAIVWAASLAPALAERRKVRSRN